MNQKQGMTCWPANFLMEAFVKWNFLCFLFLCCLLVSLARVTIVLGAPVMLFIQRFQSAPQQGFILTAGQGGRSALLCLVSRWDAGRWRDIYAWPCKAAGAEPGESPSFLIPYSVCCSLVQADVASSLKGWSLGSAGHIMNSLLSVLLESHHAKVTDLKEKPEAQIKRGSICFWELLFTL